MNRDNFDRIIELTRPSLMLVEWGYILRVMYNETGIEPYRDMAHCLSNILENNPGCGRLPIHRTNVVNLMATALIV